jgi:hypothetical protein
VDLLALMLPRAGKFAMAQDPPVPPLHWEYRDLVLPDKPNLFIRLTIVPRFYLGDPPTYVDAIYSCSPGPNEGLQPWRAEGLLRRLKDTEPVWSVSVRRTAFRRCDIDSRQDVGAGFHPPEQRPRRYHFFFESMASN